MPFVAISYCLRAGSSTPARLAAPAILPRNVLAPTAVLAARKARRETEQTIPSARCCASTMRGTLVITSFVKAPGRSIPNQSRIPALAIRSASNSFPHDRGTLIGGFKPRIIRGRRNSPPFLLSEADFPNLGRCRGSHLVGVGIGVASSAPEFSLGLQTAEATTAAGAPSFAYLAKGGYDDGIHNGRCRTDKSCAGSIAAHPCKKRKDGAPSVGMVQCKDGPPASFPESYSAEEVSLPAKLHATEIGFNAAIIF